MSVELIKYAFVAGEVSPNLGGRSDLEKYDLGVEKAENWFVDYHGGLSTRPGTQFVDFLRNDNFEIKLFPFRYGPNVANTYILVFGELYVRFVQDGAYVLEPSIDILSITQDFPPLVTTDGAHGFTNNDWVQFNVEGMTELNGQTFRVQSASTDEFTLLRAPSQKPPVDATGFSAFTSGTVSRVYTLDSPYAAEDLRLLRAVQRRDYMRLTHPSYAIRNLIRTDHANWSFEVETIGSAAAHPENVEVIASAVGSASVAFCVTAVFEDGSESSPSDIYLKTGIVNYVSGTTGQAMVRWDPVNRAVHYHIYRSLVLEGTGTFSGGDAAGSVTKADQLGFVGQSYGPSFTDPNIIPDFTRSPPIHYDPFADGAIRNIHVTNGGSGYNKTTTTVTISGGNGFRGEVIVSDAGEVIGVKVIRGGRNYSATDTITFSVGTGATAEMEVAAASGNDPGVSAVFDGRQVYAATLNQPLTLFGSRPGLFDNFDTSDIVTDGDSWEHDIESEEVAPIAHLIDVRGGLLVGSQAGLWLVHGSEGIGTPITGSSARAEPQSSHGMSRLVEPLIIDTDVLYVEFRNVAVRLANYSELAKGFEGRDMSILANHLFGTDKVIVRWALAQNPHNLVVAVREDGVLLAFTIVKEQDVYAWTPWTLGGLVEDVAVVPEGNTDSIYVVVKRFVEGRWSKYLERFTSREFKNVEDSWCVDAGLTLALTTQERQLTFEAASGTNVRVEAGNAVFASTDVGKVIRAGNGRATIVSFESAFAVRVNIELPLDTVPGTSLPVPIESNEWTMDTAVSSVSGLWQWENEEVQVVVDGNVQTPKTVENGAITLDEPGTRVVVGKGFTCTARTLPLTAGDAVIEGRRKSIIGVLARVHDTRGLRVGTTLDRLTEFRERTSELLGTPATLQQGIKEALIESHFDEDGQTYFVQEYPMPASILALVTSIDLGDDEDNRESEQ